MKVVIYGDKLFSVDMAWGFQALHHDVIIITPKSAQELDDILLTNNPDLLITVGSPAFFNPTLLGHLGNCSSSAMKCVHWDTDGITWLDIEMQHINLMRPDMVFTVCPEMLAYLRKESIPSEMLFYAFSPVSHYPGPVALENEGQITFVGGAYPQILSKYSKHYRRLSMDILFKPLLDGGYKIDFYGDNRHKQAIKSLYNFDVPNEWLHGRYPYEKTCQIYRSCSVNLVTQNHEDTLTKRTFEVLGSGGFALSYDNAAVRKLFTPGKDLVVASKPEQTLEIVEYYKNHIDEYKAIRANALFSAQKHTYKQRAELIINKLYKS